MGFVSKVKEKLSEKKAIVTTAVVGASGAVCSVPALAADATANSDLTSAATQAVSQITANINGILPIALGLLATVMGIMIGVKVFKQLGNRAV